MNNYFGPIFLSFNARLIFKSLICAALLIGLISEVHANGRVVEFHELEAGPYAVLVGTIPETPVVGPLHMTMTVTDLKSGEFLLDAQITITGNGPESTTHEIGPVKVQNSIQSPNFYDINTEVSRQGIWTFHILIEANKGQGSTQFLVDVESSSVFIRSLTWVTLVIFFALVSLGVLPFIRKQTRHLKH